MRPRTPSPPLITGIDGTVSRPPNEVNYSTLNGKRMETGTQPGNEIRLLLRKETLALRLLKLNKHRLKKLERYYVKKEENAGKNGNLIRPEDENELTNEV